MVYLFSDKTISPENVFHLNWVLMAKKSNLSNLENQISWSFYQKKLIRMFNLFNHLRKSWRAEILPKVAGRLVIFPLYLEYGRKIIHSKRSNPTSFFTLTCQLIICHVKKSDVQLFWPWKFISPILTSLPENATEIVRTLGTYEYYGFL